MSKPQNILLIEDEAGFRAPLVKILQMQGYDVLGVSTSNDALDAIEKNQYDLIITDVRLPEKMDGLDIIRIIKERHPENKSYFIVMTGYAGDDAPVRAIRLGVDDFLYKPFELEQFLYSVKKNLRLRALERQRDGYMHQIEGMRKQLEDYNLKLEEKVKERTDALTSIFAISKEINSSLKIDETIFTIVERTATALGVDICLIALIDREKDNIYVAAVNATTPENTPRARISLDDSLITWILEKREPLFVNDIAADERFIDSEYKALFHGSVICVPLIFKEKIIGIINICRKNPSQIFDLTDLTFLKTIAGQSAIAIANAQLYGDLKNLYVQVIETLNSIIEIKDSYTKGHCERVTKYALIIAKKFNLKDSDIDTLRLACELHDLGKISIHDHILTKPGKLNDQEWEEMRQHPVKGVEILKPLGFLNEVMVLIEQHHEWYNGCGYPHGLKEDQIDLRARIMSVADSFDAMTTKRPYSPAFSVEQAVTELNRCIGTQFDPDAVKAFNDVIKENPNIVAPL
jgi:putative nucleotidyltransferase with HDIG domain